MHFIPQITCFIIAQQTDFIKTEKLLLLPGIAGKDIQYTLLIPVYAEQPPRFFARLMKGSQVDVEKAGLLVLDDFRSLRLGRISLERPQDVSDRLCD